MQLSDKIKEIEFDRSSGASQLARKALDVLRFFAQTSRNKTCRGFVEDFNKLGRRLFEVRPNMAPVQNLVAQIVYEVDTLEECDLVVVRNFAIKMVRLNTNEESSIALPYRFQTVWLPMVMFYDFIEW